MVPWQGGANGTASYVEEIPQAEIDRCLVSTQAVLQLTRSSGSVRAMRRASEVGNVWRGSRGCGCFYPSSGMQRMTGSMADSWHRSRAQ